MSFGMGAIVATAGVVLGVETGQFTGGLRQAETELAASTGRMGSSLDRLEQQQLKVRIAAEKAAQAEVRYGKDSVQAMEATLRLAEAESKLASQTTRANEHISRGAAAHGNFGRSAHAAEQEVGRLTRGGLSASGMFSGLGRQVAFASGAFIGAAGFISVIKNSLDAVSSFQQGVAKTTTLFGPSGRQIEQWAKTTGDSIFVAREDALKFADGIGMMLRGFGLAQPKAAEMSKTMVELAANLAAFKGIPVADVLKAIQGGLAGMPRPMRQFGVDLSTTALQAEALRLGLVKASVDMGKVAIEQDKIAVATARVAKATADYGPSSTQAHTATEALASAEQRLQALLAGKVPKLDQLTKTQAAYSLILRGTANENDYLSKHTDTLAEKEMRLHAQWKDITLTLGTALLPSVSSLIDQFSNWIEKMTKTGELQRDLNQAVRIGTGLVHGIAGAVSLFSPILVGVTKLVGGLRNAIMLLAGAAMLNKVGLLKLSMLGIGTAATRAAAGTEVAAGRMATALGPGGPLGLAIVALSVGLLELNKHWGSLQKAVGAQAGGSLFPGQPGWMTGGKAPPGWKLAPDGKLYPIPGSDAAKQFEHGTSYDPGGAVTGLTGANKSFAAQVLAGIGAPVTPGNLALIASWIKAEGTKAKFNPLATTQNEPGATMFNTVGVKNYRTAQQGIDATIKTILNGYYQEIVAALRRGADPREIARLIGASPWGTSGANILAGLGSSGATSSPGAAAGYVSPVPANAKRMRTDQGKDYQLIPGQKIVAIGDCLVTDVRNDVQGFGSWVIYQLLNGPRVGDYVYVGHCLPLVQKGQRLKAGTPVAKALNKGLGNAGNLTGWAEVGWAAGPQGGTLAGSQGQLGANTRAGQDFASFVGGLPAPPGTTPEPLVVGSRTKAPATPAQAAIQNARLLDSEARANKDLGKALEEVRRAEAVVTAALKQKGISTKDRTALDNELATLQARESALLKKTTAKASGDITDIARLMSQEAKSGKNLQKDLAEVRKAELMIENALKAKIKDGKLRTKLLTELNSLKTQERSLEAAIVKKNTPGLIRAQDAAISKASPIDEPGRGGATLSGALADFTNLQSPGARVDATGKVIPPVSPTIEALAKNEAQLVTLLLRARKRLIALNGALAKARRAKFPNKGVITYLVGQVKTISKLISDLSSDIVDDDAAIAALKQTAYDEQINNQILLGQGDTQAQINQENELAQRLGHSPSADEWQAAFPGVPLPADLGGGDLGGSADIGAGQGGSGDSGSGSSDHGLSQDDVAALAHQNALGFLTGEYNLAHDYASNIIRMYSKGSPLFPSLPGGGKKGPSHVSVALSFPTPPADPHAFARQLHFELGALGA